MSPGWATAAAVAIAVLVLAAVGVILLGVALLQPRGRPLIAASVMRPLSAAVIGAELGLTMLLAWNQPAMWLIHAGIGAFLARWYAAHGRLPELGIVLLAAGSAWSAVIVWLLVVEPADPATGGDYRFWLVVGGLLVGTLGAALLLAAPEAATGPGAAAPRTADAAALRRPGALGRAVIEAEALGPFPRGGWAGLIAGIGLTTAVYFAGAVAKLPGLATALLGGLAFGGMLGMVWWYATPRPMRAVHEVLAWGAHREAARWQAATGRRLSAVRFPTTPAAAERWLVGQPSSRGSEPLRVAALLVAGRLREAADVVEQMRPQTPWERFQQETLREEVAWTAGADPGDGAARAAASELVDEERVEAEVLLAVREASRQVARRGDWLGPLLAARRALGARADRSGDEYRSILLVTSLAAGVVLNVIFFFVTSL